MRDPGNAKNRVDQSLACLALSDVLTKKAYAPGVGRQGESFAQISSAYEGLAKAGICYFTRSPNGEVTSKTDLSTHFRTPGDKYRELANIDLATAKEIAAGRKGK